MAVDQKGLIQDTYPIQRRGDIGIKRFAAYLASSAADGSLPAYSTDPNTVEAIFDEFTAFALMSDTQAEAVFIDQLWKVGFGSAFAQFEADPIYPDTLRPKLNQNLAAPIVYAGELLMYDDDTYGLTFGASGGLDIFSIQADGSTVAFAATNTFGLTADTSFNHYIDGNYNTDYSRLRQYYDAGAQKFFIQTEANGSGVEQALQLASNGGIFELGYNALVTLYGRVNAGFLTVTPDQYQHQILHEIQVSSGETCTVKLLPVHNETLTAGYTGYFLDATTTVLGSGAHYFASWRKGGTHYFDFNYTGNIFIHNVDSVPGNPVDGVNLYSEGGVLKYKNPGGTIALIGAWAQDLTLATYITPNGYSNITVPGLVRIGSSSTNEGHTIEWQNGGGLGGGAIFTSLDTGNTGYYQFFQQANRLFQAGFASSSGRLSVNSNAFDGGALGGFNGILHARFINTADDCGVLITRPATITGNQLAIRVADPTNVYFIVDAVGRLYAPNGTAALPSISFISDQDTGFSRSAANTITVSANAARVADFNATQLVFPTARSIRLFNTADEVTNTEYVDINWSANVAMLGTAVSGTGTIRTLQLYANGNASGTSFSAFYIRRSGTGQYFEFDISGTGAVGPLFNIMRTSNPLVASSGIQIIHAITPAVTQTSTAGWTMSFINVTDNLVSSGARHFVDYQLNSVSNFRITHLGAVTGLSYTSGNPSGGTAAAWKFGEAAVATITPDRTLRVEVAGVAYLIDAQLA